jgi:hypothetical protein
MSNLDHYGTLFRTRSLYTGESYRDLRSYADVGSVQPIPAAVGDQQWLESELFRRITDFGEWLAHPLGVARVRINPDNTLMVYVDNFYRLLKGDTKYAFAEHVVRSCLPHMCENGELRGVPGLRIVGIKGRDLTVSLPNSDCRVVLRASAGTRWSSHIAALEADLTHDALQGMWKEPTLTVRERRFEAETAPRVSVHRRELAWLGSGLLRRIALLHTSNNAYSTKQWVTAGTWFFEFDRRFDVPVDHDTLISRLCNPRRGLGLQVKHAMCMCAYPEAKWGDCVLDLEAVDGSPGVLQLRFCRRGRDDRWDRRGSLEAVGAEEQWLDRVLPR